MKAFITPVSYTHLDVYKRQTISNNNNNGNNNNSGKNNTSNNVIPNTGANSSVIIGIVAFAAIAGIAYMRLKKLENN